MVFLLYIYIRTPTRLHYPARLRARVKTNASCLSYEIYNIHLHAICILHFIHSCSTMCLPQYMPLYSCVHRTLDTPLLMNKLPHKSPATIRV